MWLSHWAVTAVIAIVASLILGLEAWGAGRVAGMHVPPGRLPALVPALTFVLSAAPFLLWRSARVEWRSDFDSSPALWSVTSVFIGIGIIAATMVVTALAADPPPGVSVPFQYVGCVVWLAGALLLHRRLVIRRFREADLI